MGFNYGEFRNRGESLPALRKTVLAALGETDYNYDHHDIQLIFDEVNANQDRVQERYNERFNFPNVKKVRR